MAVLDLKICPACGDRAQVPSVEQGQLVCGVCAHRWTFRRLPLLALTGPSGAGKSTIGPLLSPRLAGRAVLLEQDVLWTGALRDDVDGHPEFRSTWLRMAGMIGQSSRPVLLCGTVVPAELEPLPERAFFSEIHYLALVAEPEVLAARLRGRPAWREWSQPRIDEMLEFNAWLRANAATMSPPVRLLDTTHLPVPDAVAAVDSWASPLLPAPEFDGEFG